jgi:hypothetical protein
LEPVISLRRRQPPRPSAPRPKLTQLPRGRAVEQARHLVDDACAAAAAAAAQTLQPRQRADSSSISSAA